MPGFKQLRNKSPAAVLVELSDDVYRHLADPSLRSRHTFFLIITSLFGKLVNVLEKSLYLPYGRSEINAEEVNFLERNWFAQPKQKPLN